MSDAIRVESVAARPLVVLKFGGSVLRARSDLRRVAHECYRWSRGGHRVLAVVSALEGSTDRLVRLADRQAGGGGAGCASSRAQLIATGELTTAGLLSLALSRAGVPATSLTPAEIGLRTDGPPLDSTATGLDAPAVLAALERWAVVVVPGFVGIDAAGRTTLLGRGGSDLTALFVADRLRAQTCRLVKDVDGLYEFDPARPGPRPGWFEGVSWETALSLGGGIVQAKALRFARQRRLSFEVAELHGRARTTVGPGPDALARPPKPRRAAGVVLLGAGTVGLGVERLLRLEPERFAVQRVVVRDVGRARQRGVPAHLLATDPVAAAGEGAAVVVEALGGIEPALSAVRAALRSGSHVVTANKALLAAHGAELAALAELSGVRLLYSGAVGGAAPCLEAVRRVRDRVGVESVEGVLNGTTNAVLSALDDGETPEAALASARAAGLCERDATRDLSGADAADKLCLLAREAWGVDLSPQEVALSPLEGAALSDRRSGTRQIARAWRTPDGAGAAVELRVASALPHLDTGTPEGAVGRLRGPENGLVVRGCDGSVEVVRGTGAGRWPTAQAVLADLLDLWASVPNDEELGRPVPAGTAADLHPLGVRP